jgi:predicted dienelactone hydrolase
MLLKLIGLEKLKNYTRNEDTNHVGFQLRNWKFNEINYNCGIWYPSFNAEKNNIIKYSKFLSGKGILNGNIIKNIFPVIIINHGSGGDYISHSFICEYLANNGFIVISPHWPRLDIVAMNNNLFDLCNRPLLVYDAFCKLKKMISLKII